MILTYQFRLLPTRNQHRALERILESQRQLYNAALEERVDAFRKAGVSRSYFDQTKALTEWRSSDPDAAAIPLKIQRATLKRLDDAYCAFFRRVRRGETPGFPRFRSQGRFRSFAFREFMGITLRGRRLRFKSMPGSLRIHLHRALPPAPIKSCTFKRDVKGWIVAFVVEVNTAGTSANPAAVGLDLGIRTFATCSDGTVIPSLRAARNAEHRLRVAQRSLSRKRRGSRGRKKSTNDVARITAEIVRARRNHLHQATAKLVRKFGLIAIEALHVKGLTRGIVAKDAQDAAWGKFISMLHYKAERAGVQVVEVNPKNTSQLCSGCGELIRKRLDERYHSCQVCGLSLDRDLNAARNILHLAGMGRGLLNVADGRMRAGGNLRDHLREDIAQFSLFQPYSHSTES